MVCHTRYDDNKTVFFFRDPPHLIKTIRNCFARGKLWVSSLLILVAIKKYVSLCHYSAMVNQLTGN